MKRGSLFAGLVLSVCILVLFRRSDGAGVGTLTALVFLASIWLLLWALNRADPK